MKFLKYITALLLLLAFSITATQAQRFTSKKRYWSIGVSLNASNYFGDIVPKEQITSFDIKFTKPQLGFSIQRKLTPNISFRGQLAYGAFKGDDYTSVLGDKGEADAGKLETALANDNARFRLHRNLHFRNSFAEVTGSFIFDFKQNRGMFYQRPDGITPYFTAGIGAIYHNPQARTPYVQDAEGNVISGGQWTNLRPLQTEGEKYGPIAIVIPLGFGLKYKISNKVDIGIEVAYRWTSTDYLDDVSGRYSQDSTGLFQNRSLEPTSSFIDNDPRDRTEVIAYMAAHYGLVDPGTPYSDLTQANLEQLNAIYSSPLERRGNDGSPYDNPEGKKLGLFSGASDVYMVYGIHLTYILGGGVNCPKFK